MKKAIYICAAAAMALASCSNDETVEQAKGNGINFRSVAGLNTRAVNLTQNELEKKGMYVTTFSENGDRVYPETHYELDNSVWVAHPAQSWGAYSTLNFVLTSPKLSEWDSTFELTKEAEDILVTVDEEIPDQKDYMAVRLKGVSKTDSSIPVSLKHMFSSVEIRAKNTNGAYRYKVKGIRLCGVGRKALVNFNTATSLFHGIVDTRTFELTYTTPVTLGSDAQSLMGDATNAILPPQPTFGYATPEIAQKWAFESPADPRSTYISVLINLTSKYGASIYPEGSTAGNKPTAGWLYRCHTNGKEAISTSIRSTSRRVPEEWIPTIRAMP